MLRGLTYNAMIFISNSNLSIQILCAQHYVIFYVTISQLLTDTIHHCSAQQLFNIVSIRPTLSPSSVCQTAVCAGTMDAEVCLSVYLTPNPSSSSLYRSRSICPSPSTSICQEDHSLSLSLYSFLSITHPTPLTLFLSLFWQLHFFLSACYMTE